MFTVEKKISPIDKKHFSMLRANVSNFIRQNSLVYDIKENLLLDIAPQDHAGENEYFKKITIETLDINPLANTTYIADICNNNAGIINANRFDIVVCTEILEHTLNPFKAVQEIHRVLKTNGVALVSIPFNFRIHGPLPDCWRISEHGLKALFNQTSGFEITALTVVEDETRFLMP